MPDFRIDVIVDPARARQGARQVERGLQGVENRANRLRATLARTFGLLAGGAGIVGSVRVLAQFEQQMSTVQAVTGATEAEFAKLNERAQELGANTRFSAGQAAEAMVLLGRAGFNVNEIFESVSDTLLLAQAGGLGLGQAADIASNALRGFRLETDQAARVVDVLALASNSANTTVGQLGDALRFIAPVAAGVGVSIEETTAAIAQLSNAGLQGSLAGTGLRRVISELESPSSMTADILQRLGVRTEEVRISSVGLTAAIERLNRASVDTGTALTLFGDRGGPAFEVLSNATGDVRRLNEELENAAGTARRVATVMDDNLNGALLSVRSAFEAIVIAVGQAGAGGALTDLLRSLATGLRALAANADALIRVAESLAVVFSVRLAQRAIPALIGQLNSLRLALVTNPIGALAVGLTVAIGLLATFRDEITLSADSATTLGDVMVETGAVVSDVLRELSAAFSDFFAPLVGQAEEAIGGVELTFRDVLLFFAVFRDTAVGIFAGFFEGLVALFPTLPEAIASGVIQALNFMIRLVERAIDNVRALLATVAGFFSSIVQGILRGFRELASAARASFSGQPELAAEFAADAASSITNGIVGAFTNFPRALQGNLRRFANEDLLPQLVNPFEGAGEDALDAFINGFQGAQTTAGQDLLIDIFRRADARSANRQLGRAQGGAGQGTGATPAGGAGAGAGAGAGGATAGVDAAAGIAAISAEIDREITLLGLSSRERERRNELLRIEEELGRTLTDTERAQLDAKLANLQATQDQADLLDAIRGPQQDLVDRQAAANALFEQGKISLDEYNQVLRETTLAAAEAGTSVVDGLVAGLLRAEDALTDVAGLTSSTVQRAFGGLEDAFVSLATTGQANFSQLVDGILADLARLLARQAISGLINLIGSSVGGGAGGGFASLLGGLLGRQTGGPVQANQPFLVGEGGPELFVPPGDGRIVPAEDTAAVFGGQAQAAPVVNVAPAEVNVRVVNVSDPNEVANGIESPDGEQAVLNVLRKNRRAARSLIA